MSMKNCPNCGSAKDVNRVVCPFCGTSYFDLTDIDLESRHPCIVRFRMGNDTFQFKAYVSMAEFEIIPDETTYMRDMSGRLRTLERKNNFNARIEFTSW